ncbi:phage major capsid protein [Pseudoroseomonas cervicalis]|uniref:phage major capsid protein n=1 Tax=Teichococcus cervicalis TaxID=204525 RepID=UPI002789DC90|nr:phage major capsid protein [Pseudoroseomonas cervicalis]MDQ1081438.1 HK97 family phage major capsid protein [Pseudoroseomonas cervicalis]
MTRTDLMGGTALHGRAPTLERRDGGGTASFEEVRRLIEGVNRGFEEFKATNDRRLKEIESRGNADPVTSDKLGKLDEQLNKLSNELLELGKKANRIGGPGGGDHKPGDGPEHREHRAAFDTWARRGEGNEREINGLAQKAMSTLVPADGGYLVPEIVDRNILNLLRDENPMRQLANQITVSSPDYKRLVNLHGAGTGWVGETDARPATNTPQLAEIGAFMGEIYANPQVTQTLLDDSVVDLEAWLAGELAQEFGLAEGQAFISGDGVKKPKGFLAYPTAATKDGTRPLGTFQHIVTGAAAAFPASNPSDLLVSLIYMLKSGYRTNARWYLNSAVLATVRTWKDGQGNYLWQPNAAAGQPGTLLGFPIADMEQMPDVAAGSYPIAFGDMRRAYTIVDRIGTRTLRDPYTNKPYVGFYTTKRVGGMAVDTQALKFIKVAAS